MKKTPLAKATAPPAFGTPIVRGGPKWDPNGPVSVDVPKGFDHRSLGEFKSITEIRPQGGAMQGTLKGDRNGTVLAA